MTRASPILRNVTCMFAVAFLAPIALAAPARGADARHGGRDVRSHVRHRAAPHRGRDSACRHRDDHRSSSRVGVYLHFGGHDAFARRPARHWVPGHHVTETVSECVSPGRHEKRWVEPVYEVRRDACGRAYRVLVSEGHFEDVWIPARYVTREVRRWVPGHWIVRHGGGRHRLLTRFGVRAGFDF